MRRASSGHATLLTHSPLFTRQIDSRIDVWVMDADGSHLENLTDSFSFDRFAAFSPDASQLAFSSNLAGTYSIWLMASDGSDWRRLTTDQGTDWFPHWSPAGDRIVFLSNRSGQPDLWIVDADGANPTQITTSPETEFSPKWSPDGLKIGFSANYERIAFVSSLSGNNDIWVMNADGSAQTRLTDENGNDTDPAWSPDGTRIAFRSFRDGLANRIWIMDTDGANAFPLPVGGPDVSFGGSRMAAEIPVLDRLGLLLLTAFLSTAGLSVIRKKV